MQTEKNDRQTALCELLRKKNFQKQFEIVKAMKKLGFTLTQSSISRDFQELGILRMDGRYLVKEDALALPPTSMFSRFVTAVLSAGDNLIVVKTSSGSAGAVAEEIDQMECAGLVGTVAGDNTIFLATTGKKATSSVMKQLHDLER
jgi:transcriptional regulator of arginine metabolism